MPNSEHERTSRRDDRRGGYVPSKVLAITDRALNAGDVRVSLFGDRFAGLTDLSTYPVGPTVRVAEHYILRTVDDIL